MKDYNAYARKLVNDLFSTGDLKAYNKGRKTIQRQYQRMKKAGKPVQVVAPLMRAVNHLPAPAQAVKMVSRTAKNRLKKQVKTFAREGLRNKVQTAKEAVTLYRNTATGLDAETTVKYAAMELSKLPSETAVKTEVERIVSDMKKDGLNGTNDKLLMLNDKSKEAIKALASRYATMGGFDVGNLGRTLSESETLFAKRMQLSFNILNEVKAQYGAKSNEAKRVAEMIATGKTTYTNARTRESYSTMKWGAVINVVNEGINLLNNDNPLKGKLIEYIHKKH